MVKVMIVVLDEALNAGIEIARHKVVLLQDAVLQCLFDANKQSYPVFVDDMAH